jgi:hypothetical protein
MELLREVLQETSASLEDGLRVSGEPASARREA